METSLRGLGVSHRPFSVAAAMALVASLALIVSLAPLPAMAAQPSAEATYQDARQAYYALFASPKKMKLRSEWERVIRKFKRVVDTRPKHDRGRDALYTMGLLYKRLADWSGSVNDKQMATTCFNGVIARFPKSSLVDDARRHIGDIQFAGKDYAAAEASYRTASVSDASRASSAAGLAQLTQLRSYTRDGYTRIVLTLSGKTAFNEQAIKNPDRVFVDLLDTRLSGSLPRVERFAAGPVAAIRTAHNKARVTRVVFDLRGENLNHTVSSLADPFRIVIDVGSDVKPTAATAAPPISTPAPIATAGRGPSVTPPPPGKVGAIKTIVIDAGHGGKDPGAIGPTGLKEKDVTLAIARQLQRELIRRTGAKVVLTRNSDRFIELDERTVIANSLDADLFVSIHANASRNRQARGLETYFLSPARSKDELETAARENMIAIRTSDEMENDLAYIMADLSNTQKVNDSYTLAGSVQRSMVKGLRRHYGSVKDKGVKQAMFYVLWRATMPSVLVEAGFISNPTTERNFRDRRYVQNLADAIADGVVDYSRSAVVAKR